MCEKYGYDLSYGTTAYYFSWDGIFYLTTSNDILDPRYGYIYLYEDDGLWATLGVRFVWKEKPECHPLSTLFGILHKKLEFS